MPTAKRGAGSTGPRKGAAPDRRFVMVQVTPEQRQALDAGAASAGLPVSTWLRMIGLAAARKAARRAP